MIFEKDENMQADETGHFDGFHRKPYNNQFEEGTESHQQYHENYIQGFNYF